MSVVAVAAVEARIAQIEARFAPLDAFAAIFARTVHGPAGEARASASPSAGTAPPELAADLLPIASAVSPLDAAASESAAGAVSAAGAASGAAGAAATEPAGGAAPSGWAARLPAHGQRWAPAIEAAAAGAGIDPRLLAAVVQVESGFRPEARSHAGAIGLTQLMPGTARGLGVNPHDAIENLQGGARYLREQLDRFGSTELALAAYNAGPNRVAQAGGIPAIAETRAYVPKVLDAYARLR